jgi:hypothetical protein
MAKVKVIFKEVLSKEIEIEVPQELIDNKDTNKILDKAIEMYNNEEIVLTGDNCISAHVAITEEYLETHFVEI